MPIDLTSIPAPAKRRSAPSCRRWMIFLFMLVAIGGGITTFLGPVITPNQTVTFWFFFFGVALAIGGILFSLRWLVYLTGEWLADGWDRARERDLAQNIGCGQRSLAILGYAVNLPHIISADSISQQLRLLGVITLPPQVDETGKLLLHHARFNDVALPLLERIKERIRALLAEASLQRAFQHLHHQAPLAVLLQLSQSLPVATEQYSVLEQWVKDSIGLSFRITFVSGEGLQAVDGWLDSPDRMRNLLVIALNLSEKTVDGTGEVAVGVLLSLPETSLDLPCVVAHLHRPERVKRTQEIRCALLQALHWGSVIPDEITHIWLTGTGTSNQASSLLSTSGVRFPAAEQPCDIDLKIGLTGDVSSWLAISIAADQAGRSESPQLVMYVPNQSIHPWFITVNPIAK